MARSLLEYSDNCDVNDSFLGSGQEFPKLDNLEKSIFILSLTLGISLFVTSLACLVFNCVLRQNRVIKMSSPRLNMVIASGGILASACCVLEGTDYFLHVESSVSNYICQLRFGLLSVAFSLVFGPMAGRTWRVNRIFKMAGYRKVVIRDHRLLLYTSVLLCADVIVCVVWVLVDPLKYQHTLRLGSITTSPCHLQLSDLIVVPACASNWTTFWVACFLGVKLPFLVAGLREAWWTKGDLLPTINDSTSLVVSILATVAMTTVAAVTSQAFVAYPDVSKCCTVVCVWIATGVSIAAVFLPKLLLWKRAPLDSVGRVSISSTSSTKAVLHSFGQMEAELTTANSEIETLKDFIREKENSIEKLQRLLSDAEENLTQFNIDNTMTPPTSQSDYEKGLTQAKVKAGVLWLGGEHSDCPGLQDHEEYCSCNSSLDMDKGKTPNKPNNNINNNHQGSNTNPHPQSHLKSILHTTSTRCTSISTSSTTNSESSKSKSDFCNNHINKSRHAVNQNKSDIIISNNNDNNNNNNNNKVNNNIIITSNEKYNSGVHRKTMVDDDDDVGVDDDKDSGNDDNGNNMNNISHYNRRHSNQDFPFQTIHKPQGLGNKLSIMDQHIHKRSSAPLNGSPHYNSNKHSSTLGGKNITPINSSSISSNKVIDTNKFNTSSRNTPILPTDYIDYQRGDGQLLFDTSFNDKNPSLSALQNRYLRRRRSSTSSIATLSKLNRLRSNLNDALQLGHALRSGWSKDIEDMERYKRQVKMARKARRKSVPGFQNITESIMASYDFQRTADNETFISDCLSTSDWSSEIARHSKMSLASSSQSSRSTNKGRRHSECNFYFPYDRSGNLDNNTNIQLGTVHKPGDVENYDGLAKGDNPQLDFNVNFNSNVIPMINEPREESYDVRNNVRVRGRRGSTPLGTISGRIGPAALYNNFPENEQFEHFRNFNHFQSDGGRDREYGDVFGDGYCNYKETASDFLGPITPRPVLTSDSLYPPPQRHRRWSGGMAAERQEGGVGDMACYYRSGGGGGRERIAGKSIVIGREGRGHRDLGELELVRGRNRTGRGGLFLDDKGSSSVVYGGGRPSGDLEMKGRSTTLAVPNIRVDNSNSANMGRGNAVTFADKLVVTSEAGQSRNGNDVRSATPIDRNSLSIRPKFHRSVSDNILSRHSSKDPADSYQSELGYTGISIGNSFGAEQIRTDAGRKFEVDACNTFSRGRGSMAETNQRPQRTVELTILPKQLSDHGYNARGPNPPPTFHQQQQYDTDSEMGSQININVLVDSRARDRIQPRNTGGFRQSYA